MTKKITCRIIDSVPLSCDGPDLHLGWSLNTDIYPQNTPPRVVFTPCPPARESLTNPIAAGKTLDYYA
jgi:hypothetical protein